MKPEVISHARSRARIALAETPGRRASDRLAVFFDTEGTYAGATFWNLELNHWTHLAAAHLHAKSLLSLDVRPQATRRLLDPGASRRSVLPALRALPDCELAAANSMTPTAMEDSTLRSRPRCPCPPTSGPLVGGLRHAPYGAGEGLQEPEAEPPGPRCRPRPTASREIGTSE